MDKHFCPYCMTPVAEGESCPSCGLTAGNYVPSPHHLPPGTVLLDRYLVGRVLGEGGFGITYIGCDLRLELKVAIKEYYPVDRATRNASVSANVTSFIGPSSKSFERGKQKFLSEARTMARMDKQQVIVSVRDFFEANNTVYIVMEYIEGTTFAELTEQRGGRIPPGELFRVIEPLFGALSALHETGLIHRDISPDNLMLENGEVRLLDFGCAREPADGNKTLTISLKHGYAPLEQYQESGQGPWTDVYALCATVYHCLTGQTPPRALDRIGEDQLILPSKLGVAITPAQEQALLKGLRIQPNRRFQTMKELWAALYTSSGDMPAGQGEPVKRTEIPAPVAEETETDGKQEAPQQPRKPAWRRYLPYGLGAAALLLILLLALLPKKSPEMVAEPILDGVTEADAPAAPVMAEYGEPFAGATVMTEMDTDRFWALMVDENVPAIVLDIPGYDGDLGFNPNAEVGEVITKPVYIGSDMNVHPQTLEIGEGGRVEAADLTNFSAAYLRLSGSGERIRFTAPKEGWNDVYSLIWADERENLGNILDNVASFQRPHLMLGGEDALFSGAVTVTTKEELMEWAEKNVPIVVGADIEFARGDPENLFITVPLLIPEGVTVTANEGTCFYFMGSTVINRGTMQGVYSLGESSFLVNYGQLGYPEGEESFPEEGAWIDGSSVVLNFGDAYFGGLTRVFADSAIYQLGTLRTYNLYLMHNSYLRNTGTITVPGVLELHNVATLTNVGQLTVQEGGELWNYSWITNHGELRVEKNASVKNVLLENNGVFTIEPGATLDTSGSILCGSGYFDLGATDQVVYSLRWGNYPEEEFGAIRTVSQADQLREALGDPAVGSIVLTGDVLCEEDLLLTKPLTLQGTLTMSGDAALTVTGAELYMPYGAKMETSHLTLRDGAVLNLDGFDTTRLTLRGGGTLELDRGMFRGWQVPETDDPVTVMLRNRSAMAQLSAAQAMTGARIDIADHSTYLDITTLTLQDVSFTLGESAYLWLCGDILEMDGGSIQMDGLYSQVYFGATDAVFSGSSITSAGDRMHFSSDFCSLTLKDGAVFENRSEFSFAGWMSAFTVEEDASFINYGRFNFMTQDELFVVKGSYQNYGTRG